MFTIDLFKGQEIPTKSKPEDMAIAAATLAVPVIIAMVMFGCYLRNRVVMSIQKQEIVNYETKIDGLSDALELQESFKKEKILYNNCLSEVSSSIGKHPQWSPILATLVKNMPDSVVLTKLSVKQDSVRKKVPSKDDPERMVDTFVPVRILQMRVSGTPQSNCDKVVRDFRDRLRFSTLLAPKLEDIKVSHKSNTLQGQSLVSYQIDCIFKPAL